MSLFWLVLVACGPAETPPASDAPALGDRVVWALPEAAESVPLATLAAEVVAGPDGDLALHPGVSGQLVRWQVQVGDAVVAGQPLAELVSPEWGGVAARAERSAAAAAAEGDRVDVVRAAAAAGVLTRQEVAGAEASLAGLQAEARALSASLGGGALRSVGGGRLLWLAPGPGLVQALPCALGALPAPEQPCIRLVRPEGARVQVEVPERLGALPADARAHWIGTDGQVLSNLLLLARAPALDARTRSRRVWFEAGVGDLGASGRVSVSVAAPPGAGRVPLSAITHIEGAPAVFGRGGPIPVRLLGQDPRGVVVAGLPLDTEIAVRGVTLLKSLALLSEEEE